MSCFVKSYDSSVEKKKMASSERPIILREKLTQTYTKDSNFAVFQQLPTIRSNRLNVDLDYNVKRAQGNFQHFRLYISLSSAHPR